MNTLPAPNPTLKSPLAAALLSVLLPGTGQIYCGQDNKGVFLLGFSLLGFWSTGGISGWLLCPAMGIDAFLIARKFNRTAGVQRWEFFPGVPLLNKLPPRVIPVAIVIFLAAVTLARIVIYGSDYRVGE